MNNQDLGKLILRLTVGTLLLFHGVAKLKSGVAWMSGPLSGMHLPGFVAYGVYVGEVVAPILLILGIFTRPSGLIVAINFIMAITLVVHGKAFAIDPQGGGLGGELELFYLFGGLAIAFLGSGKFAVSRGRGRWD